MAAVAAGSSSGGASGGSAAAETAAAAGKPPRPRPSLGSSAGKRGGGGSGGAHGGMSAAARALEAALGGGGGGDGSDSDDGVGTGRARWGGRGRGRVAGASSDDEGAENATGVIDLSTLLEWSGGDDLEDVKEVIIRGQKFHSFDEDVLPRLAGLEILSLSHNCFTSLAQFATLENLLELNLNFNKVSSLAGLSAKRLTKLFLSNNSLRSLVGLSEFPALQTVCLYRNELFDLDAAIAVLRTLPKLRELDIDGNPCTAKMAARHVVVKSLTRLKQLDGDPVQPLDRDLAKMYLQREGSREGGAAGSLPPRPSTAPAPAARGGSVGLKGTPLPRGPVKLFRNDSLNNNATVLSYLAEGASENPYQSPASVVEELRQRGSTGLTIDGDDPVAALEILLAEGRAKEAAFNADPAVDPATDGPTDADGGGDGGDARRERTDSTGSAGLADALTGGGPPSAKMPPPKPRRTLSGRMLPVDTTIDRPPLGASPSPTSFVGRMRAHASAGRLGSAGSDGGRPGSGGSDASLSRPASHGSLTGSASSGGRPTSGGSTGSQPRRLTSLPGDVVSGGGSDMNGMRAERPLSVGSSDVAGTGDTGGRGAAAEASTGSMTSAGPSAGLVAAATRASAGIDPSDPHATIRRLLRTIEMLQDERDRLREALEEIDPEGLGLVGGEVGEWAGGGRGRSGGRTKESRRGGSGSRRRGGKRDGDASPAPAADAIPPRPSTAAAAEAAALAKEAGRLRTENANMFIIAEENRQLKGKVERLMRQLDNSELVNENKRLKLDLDELQARHMVLQSQKDLWELQGGGPLARPKTAAEVIEEVAEQDDEIAELFRRNQQSLAEIHQELDGAKRELEGAGLGAAAGAGGGGDGGGGGSASSGDDSGRRRRGARGSSRRLGGGGGGGVGSGVDSGDFSSGGEDMRRRRDGGSRDRDRDRDKERRRRARAERAAAAGSGGADERPPRGDASGRGGSRGGGSSRSGAGGDGVDGSAASVSSGGGGGGGHATPPREAPRRSRKSPSQMRRHLSDGTSTRVGVGGSDDDSGGGSGAGAGGGAAAPAGSRHSGKGRPGGGGASTDPAMSATGDLVRPSTPNLLGRDIASKADVSAAYKALADANIRRAEIAESRKALDRARGDKDANEEYFAEIRAKALAAAAAAAAAEEEGEDSDDDGDGDGDEEDGSEAGSGEDGDEGDDVAEGAEVAVGGTGANGRTQKTVRSGGADILVLSSP